MLLRAVGALLFSIASPDKVFWIVSPARAEGIVAIAKWMSRHPDGRRWIGYKTGTYIAEQASRASGKTAAQLVNVPTAEVLRLAGFD